MIYRNSPRRAVLGFLATFFCLSSLPGLAQTQFPSDAKQSCTVSSSDFQGWITLDSINLPGLDKPIGPVYDTDYGLAYIFPPDGPAFPSPASDCDFYKWGAQMFLWLTSTVSDSFTMPTNPPAPTADANYVFSSEFFYALSENAQGQDILVAQGDSNSPQVLLDVRVNKTTEQGIPDPINADDNAQAGGNGVLISQEANEISGGSELVYYGIVTNRVYGYFLNLAQPTTEADFPDSGLAVCINILWGLENGYAKNDEISKLLLFNYCDPFKSVKEVADGMAALEEKWGSDDSKMETAVNMLAGSSGSIIPSLETAVDYLSMVVEVKTSWVPARNLMHPERYVRQHAMVYDYTKTSDTLWTRNATPSELELALVGMHIVGTVDGHPEMVWATIEHKDNTPNASYPYLDQNGNVKTLTETSGTPTNDWLFSSGTAVTSVTKNAEVAGKDTKVKGANPGDIVAETGATIGPVNVNRLVPWGNPASEDTTSQPERQADLNAELIGMNGSVQTNVTGLLPSDPRANYFVSGATWTKMGQVPVSGSEDYITGSTQLANTTMETFHQELNCFGCHSRFTNSAGQPNPSVFISHLFSGLQPTLPPAQ